MEQIRSSEPVKSDDKSHESWSFKSPLRILVRSFHRSREKWKQKYMGLKRQIKQYKVQAADARRSREQWKAKAQTLQAETQRLATELAELRAAEPDKNRRLCRG